MISNVKILQGQNVTERNLQPRMGLKERLFYDTGSIIRCAINNESP